ncbi:telomere-associated recq-like helicase [Trichoderma arundinaceum]|uniref:Telomere-associated recq-like helicase n=1 Tax=Trichoderma arundinaceum TaxID=490622 RepID=A0A395N900_TRIAR|nr:telomere-associated recq-like helicase [Trichoderma arundinaceum]
MAEEDPHVRGFEPGCDKGGQGSTTPKSQVLSPLTPPPTVDRDQATNSSDETRVLSLFIARANQDKLETDLGLDTFVIPQTNYTHLQRALELNPQVKDFVDDKVRFDYEPTPGRLTVRMPSAIHEFAVNALSKRISDQLSAISKGKDPAAEFAAKIANGGSARILLDDISDDEFQPSKPVRREPDTQFQHREAFYPGVVIEVSYSQDGKSLRKLASDYILRSNGDIRVVIGLDLNYHGKESTVSMWRRNFLQEDGEELETLEVMQEIRCQPFRAPDGSPADPDACLTLRLRDFATDEIPLKYDNTVLSITYRQLYDDLTRAEEMQSARDPNKGRRSTRKTRKRKLSSSPYDGLRSDDEATFTLKEQQANERATAKDTEFSAPVSKRRA